MRIAIVNDVLMAAEALRRIIAGMPEHRVAWIAHDGAEAVARCEQDLPDLILMDLLMPNMDGVEATRQIMKSTPCPILIVTATVDGNSSQVFEALSAGALDAVQTPSSTELGKSAGVGSLKFKLDMLGRRDSSNGQQDSGDKQMNARKGVAGPTPDFLLAVGASAGGPAAVAAILEHLPTDFPAGVVIIQHLDTQFVPLMASWLNERTRIPVRIAEPGDRPQPGTALLAGTADHLVFLSAHTVGYTAEPRALVFRPSVDVFFQSVVRHWRGQVAAVLLTGMGRDGAMGLKDLRNAGALTIAQDAATSAVYGMPKAAAELSAATKILPINRIAPELVHFFSSKSLSVPS